MYVRQKERKEKKTIKGRKSRKKYKINFLRPLSFKAERTIQFGGSSINDVTHILVFSTNPSPCHDFYFKGLCSVITKTLIPKAVRSSSDGLLRPRKERLINLYEKRTYTVKCRFSWNSEDNRQITFISQKNFVSNRNFWMGLYSVSFNVTIPSQSKMHILIFFVLILLKKFWDFMIFFTLLS